VFCASFGSGDERFCRFGLRTCLQTVTRNDSCRRGYWTNHGESGT
jgi:hypothetical protein